MIKHIIFDAMGVVFTVGDDTNDLLVPYILEKKPNVAKERILSLYHEASLGNISPKSLWQGVGFSEAEIPSIEREYLETRPTLDPEFIACVKKLKDKYRIALLSNDIAEWSQYLRAFHQIDQYFDYAFISSNMRVRKPDKKIYIDALKQMDAKPRECIFIDDYPERLKSAAELGIIPILFNRENRQYNGIQVDSFRQLLRIL
ncbi:MAG: HAD-IA family hydrolase [Firmicutes bacterium]|nr:HAD-IA family hydrolase [Bacillota bacterium]